MRKLNIDWIEIAQHEIYVKYVCPICDYEYGNRIRVEKHIRQEHTQEQIKEICSK